MFCTNCGCSLDKETRFCPQCGAAVAAGQNVGEPRSNTTDTSSNTHLYEVRRAVPYAGIWALLCFIIGVFLNVVKKLCRMMFGFSVSNIFWTLSILCFILAVRFLLKIADKVYIVKCPKCNHEFGFPTTSLGEPCPKCGKRLILDNNIIKCADDT